MGHHRFTTLGLGVVTTLALAASSLLLATHAADHAAPTAQAQGLSRLTSTHDLEWVPTNAQVFTGKAKMQSYFGPDALGHSYGAIVRFEPGARTFWHSHPTGQVLIVTEGEGYVQNQHGTAQFIQKGDIVICPKETFHWHGASATSPLAHIAIGEKDATREVTWANEVSAQEFAAAVAGAVDHLGNKVAP